MKKLIPLIFFLSFLSTASYALEQCMPVDVTSSAETLPNFEGQGSVAINGTLCTDVNVSSGSLNSSSGSFKVSFDQFSYSSLYKFTATGNFDVTYLYVTSPFDIKITYNGGPINYVVDGVSYEIYYQDLSVGFDESFQKLEATGGLTVNGTYIPAADIPYDYYRFL